MTKQEKGRSAAYFSLPSSSPTSPQNTQTLSPHFPLLSPTSPQKAPCITSLRALPALSAVRPRRPLVPFSPVAPTRKLSFPTRAARASLRVSTCLQTLLVLRLDRKVSPSLFPVLLVVRVCWFADVSRVRSERYYRTVVRWSQNHQR